MQDTQPENLVLDRVSQLKQFDTATGKITMEHVLFNFGLVDYYRVTVKCKRKTMEFWFKNERDRDNQAFSAAYDLCYALFRETTAPTFTIREK